MKNDSLQFEDKSNELTVKLRSNPFNRNTYIGSIARQTVSLNTLARRIKENDTGLSDYTIFNVAGQLKKESLKALQRGQAVNVLGLGTLYMIPDGSFSATSASGALSKKLTLRFSPSEDALDAVSDVKINFVAVSDNSPQINSVEPFPKSESGEFTAGKMVHINGDRLKIAGEESGIFLCALDEDGIPVAGSEVKIEEGQIIRNKVKELEFFIPAGIKAGNYQIKLVTRYLNSSKERKSSLSTMSDTIRITA